MSRLRMKDKSEEEHPGEDSIVDIFTKTLKIANKNTVSRLNFISNHNAWSKQFETYLSTLSKTQKCLLLSLSPARYLRFLVTICIALCVFESARCKNAACCLAGFGFVICLSLLNLVTIIIVTFFTRDDKLIQSTILYVKNMTNVLRIVSTKLNRTRRHFNIISGPNFLHTIQYCELPTEFKFKSSFHSWLHRCVLWYDVWGIVVAVQISIVLYILEFPEFVWALPSLLGIVISVLVFHNYRKIAISLRKRKEVKLILESITSDYFQWFEKKCQLRNLINPQYFDIDMLEIFHCKDYTCEYTVGQTHLISLLISVGVMYGLQYGIREIFLVDAVYYLLFNRLTKKSLANEKNVKLEGQKIHHIELRKEIASCNDFIDSLTKFFTSQKLTSSVPATLPQDEHFKTDDSLMSNKDQNKYDVLSQSSEKMVKKLKNECLYETVNFPFDPLSQSPEDLKHKSHNELKPVKVLETENKGEIEIDNTDHKDVLHSELSITGEKSDNFLQTDKITLINNSLSSNGEKSPIQEESTTDQSESNSFVKKNSNQIEATDYHSLNSAIESHECCHFIWKQCQTSERSIQIERLEDEIKSNDVVKNPKCCHFIWNQCLTGLPQNHPAVKDVGQHIIDKDDIPTNKDDIPKPGSYDKKRDDKIVERSRSVNDIRSVKQSPQSLSRPLEENSNCRTTRVESQIPSKEYDKDTGRLNLDGNIFDNFVEQDETSQHNHTRPVTFVENNEVKITPGTKNGILLSDRDNEEAPEFFNKKDGKRIIEGTRIEFVKVSSDLKNYSGPEFFDEKRDGKIVNDTGAESKISTSDDNQTDVLSLDDNGMASIKKDNETEPNISLSGQGNRNDTLFFDENGMNIIAKDTEFAHKKSSSDYDSQTDTLLFDTDKREKDTSRKYENYVLNSGLFVETDYDKISENIGTKNYICGSDYKHKTDSQSFGERVDRQEKNYCESDSMNKAPLKYQVVENKSYINTLFSVSFEKDGDSIKENHTNHDEANNQRRGCLSSKKIRTLFVNKFVKTKPLKNVRKYQNRSLQLKSIAAEGDFINLSYDKSLNSECSIPELENIAGPDEDSIESLTSDVFFKSIPKAAQESRIRVSSKDESNEAEGRTNTRDQDIQRPLESNQCTRQRHVWISDVCLDNDKAQLFKEVTDIHEDEHTLDSHYAPMVNNFCSDDEHSQNYAESITAIPETYFLKCGNMNLQFTDISSKVTLKFISEGDEETSEQTVPKDKMSKTNFSFCTKSSKTNIKGLTRNYACSNSDIYQSDSADSTTSSLESDSDTESGRSITASEGDQTNSYLDVGRRIEDNPTQLITNCTDDNINKDLHFETENVKLDFAPTSSSGILQIKYRRSFGHNRLIFKSNDKKLLLKSKK